MSSKTDFKWGCGRRKSSVARVRIKEGKGSFVVNKKELKDYFPAAQNHSEVTSPLKDTDKLGSYDVHVNVEGGGLCSQSGAVRMGLARALLAFDESLESTLRQKGHLTRDARMKERKKYGQKGARARFQFSKR